MRVSVVTMGALCLVQRVALARGAAFVAHSSRVHARSSLVGASRTRMLAARGGSSGGGEDAPVLPLEERLPALRARMADAGIDALIVPSDDPHLSEYPAPCFARREFISGFTGSAGTALVTASEALLWTDGRYFLQAEMELSDAWTLMKAAQPGVPDLGTWLADAMPEGSVVGLDPLVHSAKAVDALREQLGAKGVRVQGTGEDAGNLVDAVWAGGRPPPPAARARVHPLEWAGVSVSDKLGSMRQLLKEAEAEALVVCALDEIGWLFNLRGSDLPNTPVAYGYAVLSADAATLYMDEAKLDDGVRDHLRAAGVAVAPYERALEGVRALGRAEGSVMVDVGACNAALIDALRASGGTLLNTPSPPMLAKSIKNEAELHGMREAHLRDAAALCGAFAWLEDAVAAGEAVDEYTLGERFRAFRAEQDGFLDESFPIIVGEGRNGAIIHYRAQPDACAAVRASSMILIDSGGQYECGTTDITRTIHLGEPSEVQRECFTRVLKGNIALDSVVFPEGTPGFVIDVLARRSLWQAGLDYIHGTGHGVGAGLNVHEGPHSVSPRFTNHEPLRAGMVLSNEPGFYDAELGFGVRIENLLVVAPADTANQFNGKQFFRFEKLTHVPIQRSLMQLPLLSADELRWLDEYHAQVREKVLPRVSGRAREWLLANTEPIAADAPAGSLAPAAAAAA